MKGFVKTIPDALVVSRVVITYIHIALMNFGMINPLFSAIIPWISIGTDLFDGQIARRWGKPTKLGEVMDVLGDRLLEVSYWIFFSAMGAIPFWIPLIIISRGIISDTLLGYARSKGHSRFSLTKGGLYWWLTASDLSRGGYGLIKLITFSVLAYGADATLLAYATVAFCLIKGFPTIHNAVRMILAEDSKR